MNGAKAFFDTNILLYMYGGDPRKTSVAKALFSEYAADGRMLLSTQVVEEFYAAGLRKVGIPPRELKQILTALLEYPLITLEGSHILAAIENHERFEVSFWDSLILAAAETGGAEILFTEDLNHGQRYGAVLVQNPFRSQ